MGEGDVFDFVLSRFRISLLLSIKNDAKYLPKVAQRRPYMYIRRRLAIHPKRSTTHWRKKKTTQRCTATSRQRVNTTTVCAHNKWQMRNDNIIHHAVVLLTIQPHTTRYRSNTDNFAQNAVGLSQNASLLLGLLSRCRAVIGVFTTRRCHNT